MKRKFYIFTLLITSYLFNSGFLFKPEIKALICAETYSELERNLKTQEPFIDNFPFTFDINTGQQYEYDELKNIFNPINGYVEDDWGEFEFLRSDVKNQKLYVVEVVRDFEDNRWYEYRTILDFNNLILTSYAQEFDGPVNITFQESVCANLELPKNYQISK